jgi:short-subunit dehydrogenase
MVTQPLAVIVGMGQGLSLALAQRFAAGGYRIVGFARTPAKSEDAFARMRREGLAAELKIVDAGDLKSLTVAIDETAKVHGPVQVLIYNAYRMTMAMPASLDPAEAVDDFKVNVAAPLAATQAVLPQMLEKQRGAIVFTGGGLAIDPTNWLEASSLAIGKAGVRSLALTLNKELSPKGVHVGTVTIAGAIAPATPFSPEKIANAYWSFVQDGGMQAELVYRG